MQIMGGRSRLGMEYLAHASMGGEKTLHRCKDHWTKQVCSMRAFSNLCLLGYVARQGLQRPQSPLNTISGFGWNDERGVIMADDDVWDTFIKVHHPVPICSLF